MLEYRHIYCISSKENSLCGPCAGLCGPLCARLCAAALCGGLCTMALYGPCSKGCSRCHSCLSHSFTSEAILPTSGLIFPGSQAWKITSPLASFSQSSGHGKTTSGLLFPGPRAWEDDLWPHLRSAALRCFFYSQKPDFGHRA